MSDKTPTPRMPQLQGNPIWFDLTTPDPVGARSFYSGLFGWECADVGREHVPHGDSGRWEYRGDVWGQ